jgi:hypothetical protein
MPFPQAPAYARLLLIAVFIWTCAVLFPAFPNVIGLGLDPSWKHGLNLAHAQQLVFGTDIAFTYGPLAYLDYPIAHIVNPWLVFFWNFLTYAVFIYFLAKLVGRCRSMAVAVVILTAISFAAAFRLGFESAERLQFAFLVASLYLIADPSFKNTGSFILTGVLAALSLLVKANDGVVNIAVFYAIWAFIAWQTRAIGRRAILIGLTPLVAFCVVFRLVNGPFNAIFGYLHDIALISGGYSEAMSIVGPLWQVVIAVTAIVLVFAILLIKNRDIPYGALVPIFLLSWATFKHCMVRQDGHAVPFHPELAAITGFGLLALTGGLRRNLLIALTATNICAGVLIARSKTPEIFNISLRFLSASFVFGDIERYANLEESWQVLDFYTEAALSAKKADPAVAKLIGNGSIDDLTWNIDFIAANHFRWSPRPIFQSYFAYEPALDKINAAHLHKKGAGYLSLKFEEIDGRHPFLDDVSTWREVFNHYDIGGGGLDLFVLSRMQKHRYSDLRSVTGVTRAQWGEQIQLPSVADNQVLVMRANVHRSLLGILRESIFRLDPAFLDITYKSGAKAKYRVTRPNLVNGAIISDLPQSLTEMVPLFGYDISSGRNRVAAIRWESANQAQFSDRIDLTWSVMTLRTPNRDNRLQLFHPDVSSFTSLWRPDEGIAGASALQATREDGKLVLRPVNDDPQVLLRASRDMARFNSILIRAKFSVPDQINVFFGQQANGRGFDGYIPVAGQWVDIFVKVDHNPFWKNEAGTILRFDPVTNLFRDSHIEIAGVWGSLQSQSDQSGDISVYLSQADGALPQ